MKRHSLSLSLFFFFAGGYGVRGVPAETDGASRRGCCYGKMEKEGADNVVDGAKGESGRRWD